MTSASRVAFLMQLRPGAVIEYRRRHDEIWPDLAAALTRAGIRDYSIFLNEETLELFAVLTLTPDNSREELARLPIMRRWWDYMADLMIVDETKRPVEKSLPLVFHLN